MHRQLLVVAALTAIAGHAVAAERYTVDPSHSYGNFEIGHLGLSTMHGRIDVTEGAVVIDREGDASRVEVTLDPASVDTGDAERDRHLREQKGFFEVEQFPRMRFVSTRVRFDDDDRHDATVDGKLTLHGVTRPVTLDVDDIRCKADPLEEGRTRCGFTAETKIKRSDYGMNAFIPLVDDAVEISIEAEATRPAKG